MDPIQQSNLVANATCHPWPAKAHACYHHFSSKNLLEKIYNKKTEPFFWLPFLPGNLAASVARFPFCRKAPKKKNGSLFYISVFTRKLFFPTVEPWRRWAVRSSLAMAELYTSVPAVAALPRPAPAAEVCQGCRDLWAWDFYSGVTVQANDKCLILILNRTYHPSPTKLPSVPICSV